MRRLKHTLNVVIYRAPDLPGQWIAHCLELDLVTQGNNAGHAFDMIMEAVELVLSAAENVRGGRPPTDLRVVDPDDVGAEVAQRTDVATPEFWERVAALLATLKAAPSEPDDDPGPPPLM